MGEERNNMRYIPDNVVGNTRLFGMFRLRNFIEGSLLGALLGYIVMQINFVNTVKVFFLIVGIFGGLAIGIIGFRGKSLTEAIISSILFNLQKCKYHKRSIEYVKEASFSVDHAGENLSYAEKAYYIAKQKFGQKEGSSPKKGRKKAKQTIEAVRNVFGI